MQAGQLHAQYLGVRSSDSYGRARGLRDHCNGVISELQTFRDNYQGMLPTEAVTAINGIVNSTGALIQDTSGTKDSQQEQVWAVLVLLAAFETEMSFMLSNTQEYIRTLSERAFSHLQRMIVVDLSFREKWQKAYEQGEVPAEKLGAVHLLWHGIWAFKIGAAGARTDLVYQEPALDMTDVQKYVEGIVLTEWKKAGPGDKAEQRFEEARSQANRYAQGVLAGTELAGYRYAVVVSSEQVQVPSDFSQDGIVYRHINISVNPKTPSRV
ncbi:MAG TPA: hypothetical protein ENH43_02635 [Phycisphaerales bacterium]|nr:hypothetical protein [Phycisphaerales bacterium]